MRQVTATIVADIPIESAWEKLSNLELAHYYVPDLTDTKITTDLKQGVGTSRRVSSNRPTIIETVVEWDEGQGFVLALSHDKGDGIPPMFRSAQFQYRIETESATQTRLTNTLSFEMKWGAVGNLLGSLLMGPMQKMQTQITTGQKLFYETGEKANRAQVNKLIKEG